MTCNIKLILRLLPVLWAVVFFIGCASEANSGKENKEKKAPLVETVTAQKQTISRTVEVTGDVDPFNLVGLVIGARLGYMIFYDSSALIRAPLDQAFFLMPGLFLFYGSFDDAKRKAMKVGFL